eukprot:SAG31_NODE_31406_length_368_cov_1.315985_2_plen_101_part_01
MTLPPPEPSPEPMTEEPDLDDDLTVEEMYSRWIAAAQAGIETPPKRKARTQWNRIRSVRTLNLIEDKIKELEAGARLREGGGEGDSRHGAAAGATRVALTE